MLVWTCHDILNDISEEEKGKWILANCVLAEDTGPRRGNLRKYIVALDTIEIEQFFSLLHISFSKWDET